MNLLDNMTQNDLLMTVLIITIGVVVMLIIAVAFYLMSALNKLISMERVKRGEKPQTLYQTIFKGWTDAVEIEEEETILLDHDYDGIHELDNHLPPWWKALFYVTIVFGVIYLLNYHVFQWTPLQEKEFEEEMEEARIAVAAYKKEHASNIDETNVTLLKDKGDIATGKEIYTKNCVACHGQAGEGGVGPNLTDEYWLHGGDVKDIFKTLKYGYVDKGMKSWEKEIRPDDMQRVASFILTLQGTNPPNGKEPQGDKYSSDGGSDEGGAGEEAKDDGDQATAEASTDEGSEAE